LHWLKLGAADVALQQSDMRGVVGIQREASREVLAQAGMRRLRVGDHRRVRVKQDIDGGRRWI
jgi:hypothetical protein